MNSSTAFTLTSSGNILSYSRLHSTIGTKKIKEKEVSSEITKVLKKNRNYKWTDREKELFAMGYKVFGKKWELIRSYIPLKTTSQIRRYAKKTVLKNVILKKQNLSLSFTFAHKAKENL